MTASFAHAAFGGRAMRGLALACFAALGCSGPGTPASPSFQAGGLSEGGVPEAASDAGSDASYAVCPPGLDASFDDILGRVLSTGSCGTSTAFNCHSPSGASPMGAGNLLNMALAADGGPDGGLTADQIYAELVNHASANIGCTLSKPQCQVLRVAPGDAGASFLYVKLTLKTLGDPHYGAGMPLTTPGSVCPEALDAIKTWIDRGAAR